MQRAVRRGLILSEEESLDLEAVSAACPGCHILLVEASSANTTDLVDAENAAAKAPGVVAISNSYGGSEASSETSTDGAYNHPGIAVTASSGDSGYGVEYPAPSPDVTAVGGTTLTQARARAAGRRPRGRAPAAAARPTRPSRPGSRTPDVRIARSPTCPPMPIPTLDSASMTRTTAAVPVRPATL